MMRFDGPGDDGPVAARTRRPCGRCGGNVTFAQPLSQVGVVVTVVAVKLARLAPPGPAAGPDRGYALHQRNQGLTAVQARCRASHGDGQTGPLGDQVNLRAALAPVHRVTACQAPLFTARMFTESITQRDQHRLAPGSRPRRRPGGRAWPTRGPSSTPRNAGGPSLPTARTTRTATAATCSLTVATDTIVASTARQPRRRSRPRGPRPPGPPAPAAPGAPCCWQAQSARPFPADHFADQMKMAAMWSPAR
ncbi:hypothetical protein SUDANB96_06658 [Streptomyces sp. enrichment culture]